MIKYVVIPSVFKLLFINKLVKLIGKTDSHANNFSAPKMFLNKNNCNELFVRPELFEQ